MKAIIVCGDRNWTDRQAILREMVKLPQSCIVIEGEARGADLIAKSVAQRLGMFVLQFPANWDKYHKAAGPIRNAEMLKELLKWTVVEDGKVSGVAVFAFHSDIENSKGTKNMVTIARKAGVEVFIFKD